MTVSAQAIGTHGDADHDLRHVGVTFVNTHEPSQWVIQPKTPSIIVAVELVLPLACSRFPSVLPYEAYLVFQGAGGISGAVLQW